MIENSLCIINVYSNQNYDDFVKSISEFYKISTNSLMHFPEFDAAIVSNSDYDVHKMKAFPDGFLYFPHRVEIEFKTNQTDDFVIATVSSLLLFLWKTGSSAVASCDYEYLLPYEGGYRSSLTPWP